MSHLGEPLAQVLHTFRCVNSLQLLCHCQTFRGLRRLVPPSGGVCYIVYLGFSLRSSSFLSSGGAFGLLTAQYVKWRMASLACLQGVFGVIRRPILISLSSVAQPVPFFLLGLTLDPCQTTVAPNACWKRLTTPMYSTLTNLANSALRWSKRSHTIRKCSGS